MRINRKKVIKEWNKTYYTKFINYLINKVHKDLVNDGKLTIQFQQIGSPEVILEFEVWKQVKKGITLILEFKVVYIDDLATLDDLENEIKIQMEFNALVIESNGSIVSFTDLDVVEEVVSEKIKKSISETAEKEFKRICDYFERFLEEDQDEP